MPRKKQLSLEEVDALLASYRSQKTQLDFQVQHIDGIIKELEKDRSTAAKRVPAPSRAKSTRTSSTGRRRGRPPGSKSKAKAAAVSAPKAKKTRASKPAGRKAKAATKAVAKRAPQKAAAKTRKATSNDKGGYRLSDWDQALLDMLGKANSPMRKSDLDAQFKSHKLAKAEKMNEEAVYTKVSRVLHKLANKRGIVKKVPSEGKGFAYALA